MLWADALIESYPGIHWNICLICAFLVGRLWLCLFDRDACPMKQLFSHLEKRENSISSSSNAQFYFRRSVKCVISYPSGIRNSIRLWHFCWIIGHNSMKDPMICQTKRIFHQNIGKFCVFGFHRLYFAILEKRKKDSQWALTWSIGGTLFCIFFFCCFFVWLYSFIQIAG